MANPILQILITAHDQASEALERIGAGMRGLGDAASAALEPLRTFGGLIGAALGIGGAKELQERADAYTRLTNSLKVATASEEAYQAALADVTAIAKATNSDLETTATLYTRVSQNAKAMGLASTEVADLTMLISKGMQLGGASATEYASATLQLTQAFGSGVLRGEEFNAVMEASPELMRQLAAGLGIAVGELRGLAEQGVLTSNVVSKALLSQKTAIDTAYAETTQTVEQAFTNLGNAVTFFVGRLGESTGATTGAANTLKFLADNLNVVGAALGGALVYGLGKATASTYSYVTSALAARQAAQDQAIASAAAQREAVAMAEGHVIAATAAANRAIAEQRLAQQQLLALEAVAGLFASEEALTLARTQASVAANNAGAALQRLQAAQTALTAAQGAGAASATLLSRAMGFLAGPGGLILMAVSAFAALIPMLSSTKTSTDALSASTDDYAAGLSNLNTAQLNARLLQLNQALQEQEQAVNKAAFAVKYQQGWLINATESNYKAAEAANELTVRQGKLADEEQKLAALRERVKIVTDALTVSQQQQSTLSAEQLVQFVQQGLALQKLIGTIEELEKQHKAVTSAEQSRLQAEIALANAAGDYQKAEALAIDLATKKAQAAQQQAALDHAAAVATQARVEALKGEYQGYQTLTPVQEKALITAQADARAKDAQAQASQALAAQLKHEAAAIKAAHTAELQRLETTGAYLTAAEKAAKADEAVADAALAVGKAKGDANQIIEQAKVLIDAQAKAEGLATAETLLAVKALETKKTALLESAGGYDKLNENQRLQLAQIDREIEALGKSKEASKLKQIAQNEEIVSSDLAVAASIKAARAEEDLATAKGDTTAAARAKTEAEQQEVVQAEILHDRLLADVQALEAQRDALIDAAGGYDKLLPLQRSQVDALNMQIDAKRNDIAASETQIETQQREADQAARSAGPIGQLIRLYEQKTAAAEREISAVERSYDAKLRDIDGEIQQAEAKGNTAEAQQLKIEKAELEAEKAQALADALAAQMQVEIQALEAKKLDIAASDQAIAAKAEEIAKIDELIAKKRDQVDAVQDAADSAKTEADAAKSATQSTKEAGDAAEESGKQAEGASKGVTQFSRSWFELSEAGNALADSIGWQAGALAELYDSLKRDEAAGQALTEKIKDLESALAGGGAQAKLAQQQLISMATSGYIGVEGLTQAGEAARQKLMEIKNAALDAEQALAEMAQDFEKQILQIQGNKKALLDLEQKERLAQLEELYQKSGALGSEEYAAAKARANELHQLKLQQLEDEAKADKTDQATARVSALADEAERAGKAMSALSGANLTPLVNQAGQLTNYFSRLNGVL